MPTTIGQRRLSRIAPLILQSEIRSMSVECERVGGVNLAQGVCDTELPPLVAQGAINAINSGRNTYTRWTASLRYARQSLESWRRSTGFAPIPTRRFW